MQLPPNQYGGYDSRLVTEWAYKYVCKMFRTPHLYLFNDVPNITGFQLNSGIIKFKRMNFKMRQPDVCKNCRFHIIRFVIQQ
ncbi:hypothetical protein TNCV_254001 [Trichonephila clavipes]|nr:hypothetical protein TNCV_254001 [Trichonephila clavipes]